MVTPQERRKIRAANARHMNEVMRQRLAPEGYLAWHRKNAALGGSAQTEKTKLKGFGSDPIRASKAGVLSGIQRRINKRRRARFGQ